MSREEAELIERTLSGERQQVGGWTRVACPLCDSRVGKSDRRKSMGVSQRGWYGCFRCGARGWLPWADRQAEAAPPEPEPGELGPPEDFVPLATADGLRSLALAPARDYLASRRVRAALWDEVGIGACATGRYSGRVVVPVVDARGEWLGWVARSWVPVDRPYLYPRGMHRAAIVFNARALLVHTDRPLVVVEGVFDALALWPDGVALLGKPSDPQVEMLAGAARPVAVVLDGDAWREGESLALRLRLLGQRAGHVRLPPTLDPDEVPRAWLEGEAASCITR